MSWKSTVRPGERMEHVLCCWPRFSHSSLAPFSSRGRKREVTLKNWRMSSDFARKGCFLSASSVWLLFRKIRKNSRVNESIT